MFSSPRSEVALCHKLYLPYACLCNFRRFNFQLEFAAATQPPQVASDLGSKPRLVVRRGAHQGRAGSSSRSTKAAGECDLVPCSHAEKERWRVATSAEVWGRVREERPSIRLIQDSQTVAFPLAALPLHFHARVHPLASCCLICLQSTEAILGRFEAGTYGSAHGRGMPNRGLAWRRSGYLAPSEIRRNFLSRAHGNTFSI